MTMQRLFEILSSPLKNVQWSWGAVREEDKVVFLRVWQDSFFMENGKWYVWVTDTKPELDKSSGAPERRGHIKLIREHGYRALMITCVSGDGEHREVVSFDKKDVRQGGSSFLDINGEVYMEVLSRITIDEAKLGVLK